MKKLSMVMLILMLSSFILTFTSCETDTEDLTGPINNSLPEIKAINASKTTIPAGSTIEVSVTADGDSYSWSASAGEFSSPNSATTTWTSSGISSNTVVRLQCEVTNSSGKRKVSVAVTAVVLTTPTHTWTFDSNLTSDSGVEAVGPGVTITTDAKIGGGAALCAGDENPENIPIVEDGSQLPTNAGDAYTIMTWIKTEELGYAVFSRVNPTEFWDWSEPLITWAIFNDYGYEMTFLIAGVWNPAVIEDAPQWWDGEWHHYAVTHTESDNYTLYVDGEEFAGDAPWYGDTYEDDGTSFAMGGGGWGTVLNGTLDDYKFYNQVISSAEIALLASQ